MSATARAVPLRTGAGSARRVAEPGRHAAGRALLRLVPQPSRTRRAPFAVALVVLLGGGLLGLLLLNTLVAQGSFALHALSTESRSLQLREQQLAGQLDTVQAPGHLAAAATRLGMVPGGPPVFLRLSDGRVLGTASKGQPLPGLVAPPASGSGTAGADAAGAAPMTTSAGAKGSAQPATTRSGAPRRSPSAADRSRGTQQDQGSGWTADR